MLNRWNKMFAAAALALAIPVVAHAQSSRVEGMDLQGDYIKDYTSIYSYPSSVSHVGNLVYGEFGGGSDRGVGAVLGNLWEGRFGTWAIHLRQFEPSLGQATTNTHPGIGDFGVDINTNMNRSFDIMWGKRMGGTSVGLRVNRSFGETEISTPASQFIFDPNPAIADTGTFFRNVFGVGGGLGFEVNPSTQFEVGVLWQSRTFEVTTSPIGAATNRKDDSPTTYQLAARLMWQWQPNVLVVPVFKWYSFDHSFKVTDAAGTVTRDATQKGWQIGAAGNWTLNQNDLFVLGFTAAHNTVESDTDVFGLGAAKAEESIYPQIFAALETHVNPWLTVRFGATNDANVVEKFTDFPGGGGEEKDTFSRFDMQLGCGVKIGGLQFDAIMDPDFYNRITTVGSDSAPTFGKVTATYAF